MSAVEVSNVPTAEFWAHAIKSNPKLKNVINAVAAGNLLASASGGKLSVVIDQFSGLAMTGPWVAGAANMRGSPLPPLPQNGTFDIVFTPTTVVLTIKDHSGLIIHIWNGTGTQAGLNGSYNGSWVRLSN